MSLGDSSTKVIYNLYVEPGFPLPDMVICESMRVCVCVFVCVRACACACVRERERVRVCMGVCVRLSRILCTSRCYLHLCVSGWVGGWGWGWGCMCISLSLSLSLSPSL